MTGLPNCRAAAAASGQCVHGHSLLPKPEPTNLVIMGKKGSLHRMQVARLTDSLNSRDLFALMHRRQTEAGIHPSAIDVHSARAALTVIASLFRSGQMQMFAQAIKKSGARIDPQIVFFAVDAKRDRNGILRLG